MNTNIPLPHSYNLSESVCYEDDKIGSGPIEDVLSNISDIKVCISSCQSQEGCVRVSFSQNGTCWLHKNVIGYAQSKSMIGIVTVLLKCLGMEFIQVLSWPTINMSQLTKLNKQTTVKITAVGLEIGRT